MYVGITLQNIDHPNYSEKGHYLNVRWQDFAEASGFTLIPLTSVSLADQMIREKYIQAIILSGGGNLSKDFYNQNLLKENGSDLNIEKISTKMSLEAYEVIAKVLDLEIGLFVTTENLKIEIFH